MEARIRRVGRVPFQRNTLYGPVDEQQRQRSLFAAPLADIVNTPADKYERSKLTSDEVLIAIG